jgi:hypothetical protein
MAVPALPLALLALIIPFAIYRRVRRNIGRQPLSALRLKIRTGILLTVLVLLAAPPLAHGSLAALTALAAGTFVGTGIGILALRHTRFETVDGAEYYVPHLYLGLALSSLLLGRMGYRLYELYPLMQQPGGMPLSLAPLTPLILALIALLVAYNVAFSIGLLRHVRG